MFKPESVTFDELGECLHGYEHKYGYSTIEFYQRCRGAQTVIVTRAAVHQRLFRGAEWLDLHGTPLG